MHARADECATSRSSWMQTLQLLRLSITATLLRPLKLALPRLRLGARLYLHLPFTRPPSPPPPLDALPFVVHVDDRLCECRRRRRHLVMTHVSDSPPRPCPTFDHSSRHHATLVTPIPSSSSSSSSSPSSSMAITRVPLVSSSSSAASSSSSSICVRLFHSPPPPPSPSPQSLPPPPPSPRLVPLRFPTTATATVPLSSTPLPMHILPLTARTTSTVTRLPCLPSSSSSIRCPRMLLYAKMPRLGHRLSSPKLWALICATATLSLLLSTRVSGITVRQRALTLLRRSYHAIRRFDWRGTAAFHVTRAMHASMYLSLLLGLGLGAGVGLLSGCEPAVVIGVSASMAMGCVFVMSFAVLHGVNALRAVAFALFVSVCLPFGFGCGFGLGVLGAVFLGLEDADDVREKTSDFVRNFPDFVKVVAAFTLEIL